jgi:hypothetical protein
MMLSEDNRWFDETTAEVFVTRQKKFFVTLKGTVLEHQSTDENFAVVVRPELLTKTLEGELTRLQHPPTAYGEFEKRCLEILKRRRETKNPTLCHLLSVVIDKFYPPEKEL